jgi:hypothetical protein
VDDNTPQDSPDPVAPDAVEPEVPAVDDDTNAAPEPVKADVQRAEPTDLEGDLKVVLDGLVTGAITLPEGKLATPHILAGLVAKQRGEGSPAPSGGAVAAALVRWSNVGFVTLGTAPVAFVDYTDAGREQGLRALKEQYRATLKEARAAARESVAPSAPAPEQPVAAAEPVEVAAPF